MTTTRRRLPDFVVIGVMKAGTTALFKWLDAHPAVQIPVDKEPNFFSDDRVWRRGIGWYSSVFMEVPVGSITGEASVQYADPRCARQAAKRLESTLPRARLVCLLRDPVVRLRSHYRHEVLRGREKRSFGEALEDASSPYVRRSSYASALRPWLMSAVGDRLHITLNEEVFSRDDSWVALLAHLGLAPLPRPMGEHNVTESKAAFTPAMRMLWDAGLVQRVPRPPPAVRRVARKVLLRPATMVAPLADSADEPLPSRITDILARETAETERLLDRPLPFWDSLR